MQHCTKQFLLASDSVQVNITSSALAEYSVSKLNSVSSFLDVSVPNSSPQYLSSFQKCAEERLRFSFSLLSAEKHVQRSALFGMKGLFGLLIIHFGIGTFSISGAKAYIPCPETRERDKICFSWTELPCVGAYFSSVSLWLLLSSTKCLMISVGCHNSMHLTWYSQVLFSVPLQSLQLWGWIWIPAAVQHPGFLCLAQGSGTHVLPIILQGFNKISWSISSSAKHLN